MKPLVFALVIAAILTAPVTPVAASSCINPETVTIQFAKGKRCWTYRGKATHFSGRFRKGQKLLASSTGLSFDLLGSAVLPSTGYRILDLWDESLGDLVEPDKDVDNTFIIPHAGRYIFGFSPCAMWGNSGLFIVCLVPRDG